MDLFNYDDERGKAIWVNRIKDKEDLLEEIPMHEDDDVNDKKGESKRGE